jgi:hypothetical protein
MKERIINAEDLGHFYLTSKSSPDSWLDKIEALIRGHSGKVLARAFSQAEGRAAYLLGFELDGERYKVVWPVLPTKRSIEAARVQAVTLMYHDIKAKLMTALVLGNRTAFFPYLLLPDGRHTVVEVADPDLAAMLPDLQRPLLGSGSDKQ